MEREFCPRSTVRKSFKEKKRPDRNVNIAERGLLYQGKWIRYSNNTVPPCFSAVWRAHICSAPESMNKQFLDSSFHLCKYSVIVLLWERASLCSTNPAPPSVLSRKKDGNTPRRRPALNPIFYLFSYFCQALQPKRPTRQFLTIKCEACLSSKHTASWAAWVNYYFNCSPKTPSLQISMPNSM